MKQIIAPIFKQNQEGLWDCGSNLPKKTIDCDSMTIEGIEWFTPVVNAGVFKGYDRTRGSSAPQTDSVKTVRIRVDAQTYWVAIANGADESAIADACNACCDDGTPTLATPTIPAPLVEDCVCPDANGNYNYMFPVPVLISGQTVTAVTTCGGVAQTTSTAQTSATNLRTWLAANLAPMGTWSVVTDTHGTFIKLVSTTCACASQVIDLVSHAYCLNSAMTFPNTITAVTHNTVTTTLTSPITVNSFAELIAAVAQYFADGTLSVTLAQIQYNGTGVPGKVTMGTGGNFNFTSGACVSLGGGLGSGRKSAAPKTPAKTVTKKAEAKPVVKKAEAKPVAKKAAPKKAAKKAAKKTAKK